MPQRVSSGRIEDTFRIEDTLEQTQKAAPRERSRLGVKKMGLASRRSVLVVPDGVNNDRLTFNIHTHDVTGIYTVSRECRGYGLIGENG